MIMDQGDAWVRISELFSNLESMTLQVQDLGSMIRIIT